MVNHIPNTPELALVPAPPEFELNQDSRSHPIVDILSKTPAATIKDAIDRSNSTKRSHEQEQASTITADPPAKRRGRKRKNTTTSPTISNGNRRFSDKDNPWLNDDEEFSDPDIVVAASIGCPTRMEVEPMDDDQDGENQRENNEIQTTNASQPNEMTKKEIIMSLGKLNCEGVSDLWPIFKKGVSLRDCIL